LKQGSVSFLSLELVMNVGKSFLEIEMTYYMYIETGCAFDAESEADAREQAISWFIERLQKGEIELSVEDEC
jgi:hypothetical protein